MGNSASKAARKLPKTVPQQIQTTLKVEPTRATPADTARDSVAKSERPDGGDPDDLLARLGRLGPVNLKEAQDKYRPATEDVLVQTLDYRAKVQAADAVAKNSAGLNTTVPVQTITSILQSLQAGDSKDAVELSYNLAPGVVEKLSALSVPPMAVGRRRT